MKLYVSGNSNGLLTKVESIFLDTEIELSNRYEIMNAYELGFLTESMTKENTCEWFSLLRSCDAIYLLDGWMDSNHCIVEKEVMQVMGKEIFYEHPNQINNLFEKTDSLRHAIHEVFGLSFSEIRKKGRNVKFKIGSKHNI